MGERTFVTLVDANKPGPRELDVIERDVIAATQELSKLARDIDAMEDTRDNLSRTISALRTEFYNACAIRYPGMGHQRGV